MLNVDNAAFFLFDHGLLGVEAAIDGDLQITSSTRRNRNLVVETPGRGGYLIKQPEAQSPDATASLRTEIAFYRCCEEEIDVPAVSDLLPRLVFADPEAAILALELVAEATQLWRFYESCEGREFPTAVAEAVGMSLAAVHRELSAPEVLGAEAIADLADAPPAVLSLAFPKVAVRAGISPASLQLVQEVQAEAGMVGRLEALAERWRSTTVIHGDVKLDNILVQGIEGLPSGKLPRVYLVDWELVQRGDPAWDLAGALRDFIFFWVISMPNGLSPEEMAGRARFPLDVLQPAIRALWSGYARGAGGSAAEREALLDRAIGFSGVRMIQTALDMAASFVAVPAPADRLLGVALKLMADPEQARTELYGLPPAVGSGR